MGKTVLVLGSTGFAGSHFARRASEAGMRVVGASRQGAELAVDLLDPGSLVAAVEAARPDAVVNLAGSASVARSWREPDEARAVNADSTEALFDAVEAGAPSSYVLCVSSGEIYGGVPPAELPATEERSPDPGNPYAESKVGMEEIANARASRGSRVGIARAFNHIGPGQSDSFAISSFARQIATAEHEGVDATTIAVGDLSPRRDFTDVRDVAAAYVAMVERGLEGTYNVCSGRARAIGEVAETLADRARVEVTFEVDPERLRPADVPIAYGSAGKLAEATGWGPEVPLERTLDDLLAWWRERIGDD